MFSMPFTSQYTHKNPTKFQINPSSRFFFISIDTALWKIAKNFEIFFDPLIISTSV